MDEVLEILKEGNIFVSLHTNGTLLDERRVSELAGLVDDIALPIDSTRKRTQNEIRCEKFLPVLDKLPSLAKAITGKGMLLGYHTVFTMKNCNDLPAIYHFINKHHFDYWRIYEFNDYLAVTSLINQKLCLTRKDQEKFQRRKRSILMLRGTDGWHEDAKDELSPIYNRESEKFQHDKDLRIQFVAISGVKEAYAFLDNTGRISTYTCLSGTTRFELGNILYEGFGTVMRRLSRLDAKAEELSRS
jgi:MoaA/NifB/PqqE/SkfB family radical SAM enzyme